MEIMQQKRNPHLRLYKNTD